MPATCALDVAEDNPDGLGPVDVARLLGLDAAHVARTEARALGKIAAELRRDGPRERDGVTLDAIVAALPELDEVQLTNLARAIVDEQCRRVFTRRREDAQASLAELEKGAAE